MTELKEMSEQIDEIKLSSINTVGELIQLLQKHKRELAAEWEKQSTRFFKVI